MKNPTSADYRWAMVLNLYLLAAVWGAGQVFAYSNGCLYLVWWLLTASAATTWAVIDARYAGRPMLHIVQHAIFATWEVSLPIYLIRTRGLRGLGFVVLHGIGLLVTIYVYFYVALVLVY